MAINMLLIGGAVVGVLALAPFALPSSAVVERTAIVDADPASVFQLLSSAKGYQSFNPYKDTDPNLQITFSGPETGIGSSFEFKGKEGEGTQTITAMEENKSVTVLIDLGSLGQPVTTFELSAKGQGTQVVWHTKSDFGMNPIGRVFGLFLDGMLGKTYERGLKNLNTAVASA